MLSQTLLAHIPGTSVQELLRTQIKGIKVHLPTFEPSAPRAEISLFTRECFGPFVREIKKYTRLRRVEIVSRSVFPAAFWEEVQEVGFDRLVPADKYQRHGPFRYGYAYKIEIYRLHGERDDVAESYIAESYKERDELEAATPHVMPLK